MLMLPQARPRSPSPAPCANWEESVVANSIAWPVICKPPIETTSVPTVPEADEESPYEIFHVEPVDFLNVEDFFGSKMVWPVAPEIVALGRDVDHTCEDWLVLRC